ncbi:MAG TPA: hypothetical protein VHW01_23810, partial [Polyangiaceae bacterium]|nr:hypothetical protein [Polyangiaceae bacterium]
MASPIIDLLKRTLSVGGSEVRLIPGRRTVVVMPAGESEVRGDLQTTERVQAMIDPVMPPEARRGLSSGYAEWDFPLEDKGPVRGKAEMKGGQLSAFFFLDMCDNDPRPAARAPVALPNVGFGMAAPSANIIEADLERAPAMSVPSPSGSFAASRPSMPAVSGRPTAEIDRLLKQLVESKGSDLHMSITSPPMIRKDGEMQQLPGQQVLTGESMERMIMPIVPPRNKEEFARTHDTDFAYELPGICRFRANLFVDLRGVGAVFRVIPSKILSVDELGIPKEVLSLCHLPKGLVLVTGPTGSGKSTT